MLPSLHGALLSIVFFVTAGLSNVGAAMGFLLASAFLLHLYHRENASEVSIGVLIAGLMCFLLGLVFAPESMLYAVPFALFPFTVCYLAGTFLAKLCLRFAISRKSKR